jgi:hypothetical protein
VSQWYSTKSLSPSLGVVMTTFFAEIQVALDKVQQKILGKEVITDVQFINTSLSSVTLVNSLPSVF